MDVSQLTAEELLKMLDIARHLSEQRLVQPLLEYVAATVFTIIPAERCLIVLFLEDGALQIPVTRTYTGEPVDDADDQISRSILEEVRATRVPIRINDALADDQLQQSYSVRRLGLRSVMCAPLVSHNQAIGAIYIENRAAGGRFTDENLVPLVLFANQIVVALENARMVEALEATVALRTQDLQVANEQLAQLIRQRNEQLRVTKQALRDTANYYELISENSNDLIALLNTAGKIQYASPSYTRLLGYEPAQLAGRHWFDLIHADDRPIISVNFQQSLTQGSTRSVARLVPASHEQQLRWVEASFSTAKQLGTRYVVVIARDITARRALENQLVQAQKMEAMGRLAGSVAHDFNNLLVVVGGCASLLTEKLGENHPAQSEVEAISAATDRAASLTRQLLTFARREAAVPTLLRLDAVLHDIRNLLQRLLGPRIALALNVADDSWPVHADRAQIEQVVINMAANARDAMPQGGRLTIDLANVELPSDAAKPQVRPGGYAQLVIGDTGVGMPPEVLVRLFEPFFTTKPPGQGTGLGLATCYGIVTQNGGTITVTSAPGAGSTFTILLPRAAEAREAAREAAQPEPPLVLLVEAARPTRTRIAQLLQQHGFQVITAASATHALRLAAKQRVRIDLLVTALALPRMNGAALAAELCRTFPSMKVVLTTRADASEQQLAAYVQQGAQEVGITMLTHPWTPVELGRLVQQLLG